MSGADERGPTGDPRPGPGERPEADTGAGGTGAGREDERPTSARAGDGPTPASAGDDTSGSATRGTGGRGGDAGRSRGKVDRAGEGPGDTAGADEPASAPTPLTQQLGRVFIVLLAVLFGVFAVANSQAVDFSWVFGETEVRPDPTGDGEIGGVPLIVLLLGAFAIGAAIGAFTTRQVRRARRGRHR